MSTEQQRQQWRELAAAATPGEWEPRMDWGKDMTFEGDVFYYGEAQGPHLELDTWDVIGKVRADAAFIAAARAAVPQLLADVDALQAERDALAAELERVRAQLERLTVPKFIDKVTELGSYVATLVPVRKFDIVPYHNNKRYSLTWTIELDSGNTRDFNVLVTDDDKNEPFSADENVDEIVRTIQRTISQWEYEELLQRTR